MHLFSTYPNASQIILISCNIPQRTHSPTSFPQISGPQFFHTACRGGVFLPGLLGDVITFLFSLFFTSLVLCFSLSPFCADSRRANRSIFEANISAYCMPLFFFSHTKKHVTIPVLAKLCHQRLLWGVVVIFRNANLHNYREAKPSPLQVAVDM